MTITLKRDRSHKMRHVINVRQHSMSADEGATVGGENVAVADKCPVHKLMTKVTTEITTALSAAP
ncbi:MAG: hypothetical protein V4794_10070 [Pseudomonadota bacterium]